MTNLSAMAFVAESVEQSNRFQGIWIPFLSVSLYVEFFNIHVHVSMYILYVSTYIYI